MSETPPKTPQGLAGLPRPKVARLPSGVYVPMCAFFNEHTEEVDLAATQAHASRLIHSGVAGLVVHGSNGEAVHLSRGERAAIIKAVVDTVRHDAEHPHAPFPVITGCSAQGTRETVELCREAADAGATHAIILPPGYYAPLLGRDGVLDYFLGVAEASPIPVLIYNYPAAASGVDLDSDAIVALARHERIVGVKLTCGNTGKLARVVAGTARFRDDFFVAGGSADFILQGAVAGAHGTISGLANLAPLACRKILDFYRQGKLHEAQALQHEVAEYDWVLIRLGFVGVKKALALFGNIRDEALRPRRPFKGLTEAQRAEVDGLAPLYYDIERGLAEEAGCGVR